MTDTNRDDPTKDLAASQHTAPEEIKFYDGMPEEELERLLLASFDEEVSVPQKAPPTSTTMTSKINKEAMNKPASAMIEALRQDALAKKALQDETFSKTQSKKISENKQTQKETLEKDSVSTLTSTTLHSRIADESTVKNQSTVTVQATTEHRSEPTSMSARADSNAISAPINESDIVFDKTVRNIEQTIANIKDRLEYIARESTAFNNMITSLIEEIRELQQLGEDDFSITYEQAYQLRSTLYVTRRTFNEIPNFLDMVEESWENDIYTAQMRQKYVKQKK